MKTQSLLLKLAGAILALGVLAIISIVKAQDSEKSYRVGFLRSSFSEYRVNYYLPGNLEGFGYVAGQNIEYHDKSAVDTDDQLAALVDELVQLPVDVIVAEGISAVQAARDATDTIPILMFVEADPVEAELVTSFTNPGKNVTGVTVHVPGVNRTRLELLTEIDPEVKRVGVLYNAANPEMEALWHSTESAAEALGLETFSLGVTSIDDELAQKFELAIHKRCDAVLVLHDRLIYAIGGSGIPKVAKEYRLPVIYPASWYSRTGALMTYGPSLFDLNHALATQVDRVLKGANPADMSVERAATELYVNTDAARAIDLTVPVALRERADRLLP